MITYSFNDDRLTLGVDACPEKGLQVSFAVCVILERNKTRRWAAEL